MNNWIHQGGYTPKDNGDVPIKGPQGGSGSSNNFESTILQFKQLCIKNFVNQTIVRNLIIKGLILETMLDNPKIYDKYVNKYDEQAKNFDYIFNNDELNNLESNNDE